MKHLATESVAVATRLSARIVLLGATLLGSVVVGQAAETPPSDGLVQIGANSDAKATQPEWETKWGIQITALRISAAGNVIDFRYRVTDSDKASALGNPKSKPALIDKITGKILYVPNTKAGQMRSTGQRLAAGKTYTALFANPGKVVKPGNKVTIVIGDFRAEDLTVGE
jgi:hypothetical protein